MTYMVLAVVCTCGPAAWFTARLKVERRGCDAERQGEYSECGLEKHDGKYKGFLIGESE